MSAPLSLYELGIDGSPFAKSTYFFALIKFFLIRDSSAKAIYEIPCLLTLLADFANNLHK